MKKRGMMIFYVTTRQPMGPKYLMISFPLCAGSLETQLKCLRRALSLRTLRYCINATTKHIIMQFFVHVLSDFKMFYFGIWCAIQKIRIVIYETPFNIFSLVILISIVYGIIYLVVSCSLKESIHNLSVQTRELSILKVAIDL